MLFANNSVSILLSLTKSNFLEIKIEYALVTQRNFCRITTIE